MTIADLANLPPTISVDRAAEILGISRGLAYQGVRDGSIPSLSIGRRIVIPTARLLEILGAAPSEVPHTDEKGADHATA